MEFNDFGFQPAYTCEVDPEFPPDGNWRVKTLAFRKHHEHAIPIDNFHSTWGTPIVLRLTPDKGQPWVGFFEGGGAGLLTTVCATPANNQLCVVTGGFVYLVDVRQPAQYASPKDDVTEARGFPEYQTLLLAGFTNLTSVDAEGVRWTSQRLCLDDLKIDGPVESGIKASGDFVGTREEFVVSPTTGEVVAGERFDLW